MLLRRSVSRNSYTLNGAMRRDKSQLLEPAALHGSAIRFPGNQGRRRGRRTGAAYRFGASPTMECATALLSCSDHLKGRTENRQTTSFVPQTTVILLAWSRSLRAQMPLRLTQRLLDTREALPALARAAEIDPTLSSGRPRRVVRSWPQSRRWRARARTDLRERRLSSWVACHAPLTILSPARETSGCGPVLVTHEAPDEIPEPPWTARFVHDCA
ncbi:hypothetical protein ABIA16_004506 [Sinorhizobium fredii]